jgi:envelope integrity protein B
MFQAPGGQEIPQMTIFTSLRLASLTLAVAAVIGGPWTAAAVTPTGELAAHRAVYELKLAKTTGKGGAVAARGRILYDFTGNVCDGYKLEFRQVSELDNGEGKVTLSDLRSTTWEDGAAKAYQFTSQNYLNQQLIDAVDGRAERRQNVIAVTLSKPKDKKLDLEAAIIFPTEHVRKILDAARDNKTILELPVYDGSESGEKVYNTLTVIGREIGPEHVPNDAARDRKELAGMKRWPVTVSYFDKSEKADKTGEQLPVYAISFELYENGISRALLLDYNNFTISGELTALDIKDTKPCP